MPLDSSDPGFGKFMPVDTDHLHVCKPCSKDDYSYTMSVHFIKECISRKKREKALEGAIFSITDSVQPKDEREEEELTEMISMCC